MFRLCDLRVYIYMYVSIFEICTTKMISLQDCVAYNQSLKCPIGIVLQHTNRFVIGAFAQEKQQSAYAKIKTQMSCAVTVKLTSVFIFAAQIGQCLLYLNSKFQASSLLL